MRKNLTFTSESNAKKLPPPAGKAGYVEYWHAGVSGFGVRVHKPTAKGAVRRVWVAKLSSKVGSGGDKPILGTLGDISMEAAKLKALELRRDARVEREQGIAAAPKLKEAYAMLVSERKSKWSSITLLDYDKRMKVIDDWGDKPIDTLTPKMWADKYDHIVKNNGEAQGKGVLRVVSSIYNHIMPTHDSVSNPISRISRKLGIYAKNEAATRPISSENLHLAWALFDAKGGVYRDWILFALFTGFRASLVGKASWDRIDLRNRTYLIHKNDPGNKSRAEILYPLPDWLCDSVLLPRFKTRDVGNPWVFPSRKCPKVPLPDIVAVTRVWDKKPGLRVRPHVLRATFATVADAVLGNTIILSALLTHATGRKSQIGDELTPDVSVTAGYVKKEQGELRKAINKVAARIVKHAKRAEPVRFVEEVREAA